MNDIRSSNEDLFSEYEPLKMDAGENQIFRCTGVPSFEGRISVSSEQSASSLDGKLSRTWGGARGSSCVWSAVEACGGGGGGAGEGRRRGGGVKGAAGGRVRSARARLAPPGTPCSATRRPHASTANNNAEGRGRGGQQHTAAATVGAWRQRAHLRNVARGHLEDMFARYADENAQLRQQRHQLQTQLRTVGARYLYLRLQSMNPSPPCTLKGSRCPQGPREAQQLQEEQKLRLMSLQAEQQALRRRSQAMGLQLSLHGGDFKDDQLTDKLINSRSNDAGDELLKPLSLQQLEIERLRALISERRQELNQLRRNLADDRRALLAVQEQVRLKRRAVAADIRTIRWHRAQLSRARVRRSSSGPSPSPPAPRRRRVHALLGPPRVSAPRSEYTPSPYAARALSVPRRNNASSSSPSPPTACHSFRSSAEAAVVPLDSDLVASAILPSSASDASLHADGGLFSLPHTSTSSVQVVFERPPSSIERRPSSSSNDDEDEEEEEEEEEEDEEEEDEEGGGSSSSSSDAMDSSPRTVESDADTVLVTATESLAELKPLRCLDEEEGRRKAPRPSPLQRSPPAPLKG